MAAMQPVPAAETAWRYTWSATSPAANTPGILVAVCARLGARQDEIAVLVHVELPLEEVGVRLVADGHEHAVARDGLDGAGLEVLHARPGDAALARLADDLLDRRCSSSQSIFGLSFARCTMIAEARKSSRRCTTVTRLACLVR